MRDQPISFFVRSRDSDTKARVKLVDRGEEVVLDTSELLPLNPVYEKLPAFAQPFRMDGFEESVRIQSCSAMNIGSNSSIFTL